MKKPNFYIRVLGLLMLAVIIQACNNNSTVNDGYHIKADINGLINGKAHLVKLDLNTNEQVNIDSTTIENGKFSFKGKVDSPYLHTLILNGKSNKIHLFLDNSNIDIRGNIDDLEKVHITGSREDSLFRSYDMDAMFDRKKGMDIMLAHPDYTFAAFTAYYYFQLYNIQTDTLNQIMSSFSNPVKKTVYYTHLEELTTTLKSVAISQAAPSFEILNTHEESVQLNDFKGKFLLIDFWASWCAPCRAANPTLVKAYNTYNKRNFTILGISVDKNKASWLKAVEVDGLLWPNVSNLKGWGEVSNAYGVKAVPQNFLIDPNGIIIDKNIEPDDLMQKLNDVLPQK